ncbi:MAG: DUF3999 family protein [Terracidiphilus sp.]
MKLFAALLLIAAVGDPAPEIRYFKYQRTVQIPPEVSGQTCAELDAQTFAHASEGLADLRLYRQTAEVPYVIHSAMSHAPVTQSIPLLNPGRRKDETVFDVAMPEGEFSDLQLDVTSENFLATVVVSGSQSATGPVTRIGSYTIFDFSGQRLGRSTVLHLPKSNFRVLHFEIAGPIAPNRVNGVSAAPAPLSEPKYLTVTDAVHFVQKGRDSVAEFTLPASVPVDRIVFVPPAEPVNFSRDVSVEVAETPSAKDDSAERLPPPVSGYGNLLRIHRLLDRHHVDEERLVVDPPQAAFRSPAKWTITVSNGDDAPIGFTSVRFEMLQRDLCFEAVANASYVLYYGDNSLFAPRYDYARWFAAQAGAPAATLGPEQVDASYQPRPDARPFTERHPALLWLALVAIVLLLGIIAFRSAKRVEPAAQMP